MTEPFNELTDAEIHRVDLVDQPANGVPFLIAKSAGLVDPVQVRDLVEKAEDVEKATISTADMNDKPDSDFAYIEAGGHKVDGKTEPRSLRHFYIGDASHVRDALARASQSPFGDKAMPKIKAAAKKFGIDVSKATNNDAANADAAAAVLGDNEPLPDADEVMASAQQSADGSGVPANADGDPDDPESPAWEAVDAARARQALELTVALRRLVCLAQEREQQETAVDADDDDSQNIMQLGDALCAIDCVIGILAPFAICEQAEADGRQADRDALLKGMVRKAGRVLSGQNEQGIRQAAALLEKVLATLPAPVDEKGEPMQVEKAKGDPQVAVYTSDGKLVGVVDQADISPVASAPAADDNDKPAEPAAEPAAEPEPGAEPAPEPSADADDAQTIPGTDTVQAPAEQAEPDAKTDDDADVAKTVAELVKAALQDRDDQLAAQIDVLKAQLEAYGAAPAPGGPRLNGATGTPGLARRDETPEDEATQLRKAAEQESDPKRRESLSYAAALAGVRKAQEGRARHIGDAPVNAQAVLARFTR